MEIQYLGHSGFRIVHKGTEILIDPYFSNDDKRSTEAEFDFRHLKPKFILITHEHFDHCDVGTVSVLAKKFNAKIIGPPPVERKFNSKIIKVRPGTKLEYDNFSIRAVPAFHHQSEFPIGYLLDFNGLRVYHAGDTYYDSELTKINTDVAILPIGGEYTMNAAEALKLAEEMGPRIIIPMHFDTFDEIKADPFEMAEKSDKVVVLKVGEVLEVE
ncbi:MAG: metal-dependent hydrolase [Candidatus Altiarchaeota archaeon]|nr:metal-dependent hydrolase [Candidatus Altiarchaeota archaeon]